MRSLSPPTHFFLFPGFTGNPSKYLRGGGVVSFLERFKENQMRYYSYYGFYDLEPFPGNFNICISLHATVYLHMRGKGYGQKQHLERLDTARKLGYKYIICTVKATNEVEKHILAKNGWKQLDNFLNQEHEGILIYGRNLE